MAAVIAIVGRPNVGKSALFNRIVGRRIAIVHDEPGVTRDRISAEAEWNGRPFTLIDTGGLGLVRGEKSQDVIIKATYDQAQAAMDSANAIILVVNVQEGIVPLDREVADRLRRSGKPILIAVNKVDTFRAEAGADEFSALGFDKIFPVTAIHGSGIDTLVEAAVRLLPPLEPHADWLLQLIRGQPDLTLEAIVAKCAEKIGIETSEASLRRFFKRHIITFKKKPARGGAGASRRGAGAPALDARTGHV